MPDYRKNNSLLNSLQKISKTSTDINNQATLSGFQFSFYHSGTLKCLLFPIKEWLPMTTLTY